MATLSQYLTTLRNLIQSPTSPIPLLPDDLLTIYINLARAQTAIDAECVRGSGTVVVGAGTVVVPIWTIVPEQAAGISQAIVVRNALLDNRRVDIRPWDWFANYFLAGPPSSTIPTPTLAHQGQGDFTTLYVSSPGGNLLVDLVLLPADLVSDATPDVIPYPWRDAVAFYAAWYSYQSMQRQADANTFFTRYMEVLRRGRSTVTSTALPENDPGGVGATIATTKTTLGAPQPRAQPQQRGR